MDNYYLNKIIELDADGVDFIPLFQKEPYTIIASFTREDFKEGNVRYIPKTNYVFYKMIDGRKEYLINDIHSAADTLHY